jgi:hypothetical protein
MWGVSLALALLVAVMISSEASAQDLDQDKTAAKLFAASCADCHRSARGLAKGRFSITLWYYLQQHYTSSSATARTLTAYLQSLDTPPRSKSGKSPPQATKSEATSTSGLRPPAPVPGR